MSESGEKILSFVKNAIEEDEFQPIDLDNDNRSTPHRFMTFQPHQTLS